MNTPFLGVNIDHIATLRQARGTVYPSVLQAALLAEQSGADGITVHLREDRRHIQLRDLELLEETIQTRLNLEMAVTENMLQIAEKMKPRHVCLVPEKREELTTEGGLEVAAQMSQIKEACQRLSAQGIEVSLFIDPDKAQIEAAKECGAQAIEIHTGAYADAPNVVKEKQELQRIQAAAKHAQQGNLITNAGHGLNYHNTIPIAVIPGIHELNIGHAIIARACFTGLEKAVRDMKNIISVAAS